MTPHDLTDAPSTVGPRTVPPEPFLWRTGGGEDLAPAAMSTLHLWHTVLMLWNHSAPERLWVGRRAGYEDVGQWSLAYRAAAFRALTAELAGREMSDHEARDHGFLCDNAATVFPEPQSISYATSRPDDRSSAGQSA